MKYIVSVIFACGLFFNALVFIPQAIKIFKNKSADNLSVYTFFGFNIMQFFAILHGYYQQDMVLMLGFMLSFITCGSVTLLILKYKQ